jgi:hypothetical protein
MHGVVIYLNAPGGVAKRLKMLTYYYRSTEKTLLSIGAADDAVIAGLGNEVWRRDSLLIFFSALTVVRPYWVKVLDLWRR